MIEKIISSILDWSPIVLSAVAVSVSILTVQMQKKTDLFDKRYDAYYMAKQILKYKDEIIKFKNVSGENYDLANMYFAFWISKNLEFNNKLDATNNTEIIKQINLINNRKNLELKELDKIDLLYLLEENEKASIANFIEAYSEFVDEMAIISYGIDKNIDISISRENFIKVAEEFENTVLSKLRNTIDVSNLNVKNK